MVPPRAVVEMVMRRMANSLCCTYWTRKMDSAAKQDAIRNAISYYMYIHTGIQELYYLQLRVNLFPNSDKVSVYCFKLHVDLEFNSV